MKYFDKSIFYIYILMYPLYIYFDSGFPMVIAMFISLNRSEKDPESHGSSFFIFFLGCNFFVYLAVIISTELDLLFRRPLNSNFFTTYILGSLLCALGASFFYQYSKKLWNKISP